MVAILGETTGACALRSMHQRMQGNAEGRRILRERPRINTRTVDPLLLEQYPQETFGWNYYKFMADRGFVSDDRSLFIVDPIKLNSGHLSNLWMMKTLPM